MEKPTKKEGIILSVIAVLVLIAWLCRIFDIPWEGGCNPIRSTIYLSLFFFWGFTLHRRLIHSQVRHLAISIAVLILFWFAVRTVKFTIVDSFSVLTRYMWYLYYLPMIFIPLLTLLTALTVGLPETQRLPRKYNVLWFFAAVLFALVITNDLHQLVFTFPNNGALWSDDDYSYSIGYYMFAVWMAVCDLATFILLAVKSRRPKSRRWMLLPCISVCLLIVYWILYIFRVRWAMYLFGDMTAVSCVLIAAAFELCIRCGLVRSNTGYGELFRAASLGVQITDQGDHVRLSGAGSIALTKEQRNSVKEQPLFMNKTTLVKSEPIRFGRVLWQEDVSSLIEVIEQSEENCRDLDERNRISEESLKAKQALLALQEKNRVADLLQRQTAGQIDLIERLLSRYDSESDEHMRRRLLAGVAVMGAYLKRCGNLLLISEKNDEADVSDLIRCFEETFLNLELLDVNCLCSLSSEYLLKTEDMLRIYRVFECILEDCLFELHDVWINVREQEEFLILNMEFVSDKNLTGHAPKADDFSFDSGTSRFTFRVPKGDAKA